MWGLGRRLSHLRRCEFGGELYPNLGELRAVRWTVESVERRGGDKAAKFPAFGPISPVRAEKTVTLAGHAPVLRMQYEVTGLGPLPLDFIWGTHPALGAASHTILRIPGRKGIVGQASDATLGVPGQRYSWPILETGTGRTDMSRVPGIEAKVFCGHYVTDLEAGWFAAEDTETGESVLFQFPKDVCPWLWLWLDYGGWRGYHNVIIEPWTSCPVNLAEAVRQKTRS